ncbi:MAG: hypothetical protein IT347_01720 [Candidatus Eisenbacteria bacterium]|nr:hypothetical protein [Candidatus Eisenbacteria bacterium]
MRAQPAAPRANGEPEPRETIAYAELLKLAHDEGLKSIATSLVLTPSEDNGRLAIVKASVETERGHFEALGDADPGNVDDFLAPHLIRVAETRAKARALRDACNVGVVSSEELDGVSRDRTPSPGPGAHPARPNGTSRTTTRPRGNGSAPRSNASGSPEPMTEGQRRYLFRILAGQGYQREAAEVRIKELFDVDSLAEITKTGAMQMIDRLLNPVPATAGGGNGAETRPLR